jgi:hypothetical protein
MDYFFINKFEDDNLANFSKEFNTVGAVGITFNNYFIFASVARKEYIASMNKRISHGLGGLLCMGLRGGKHHPSGRGWIAPL